MSGGQPTDNDQTHSDPEEFPDRIGTVVTPPMPSYVPVQPQIDEYPNNAPDEYTKPPGTTYKFPGQPDAPDGPPPNAIPIVPHPTTPMVPETGPAIPLTDRPQVPIPDHAVPGAPAEDDRQKPRVHDSEPPLPRHNNTPAPHLPATPAEHPTELNPPSHYATTPDPETPGAPTDPTATPQLHRDSTQYIPDLTIQPTRGGTPATTLAGPLPQSVVPARPVPMASASAEPKKRKRKPNTPPPEARQPTPKPPAPIPVPTPQPKPKPSRPSTPPARTKATTQSARTTGRDLAITFASASGSGALTMPALTRTDQRSRNLAETMLTGGGLATATRPTRTMGTQVRPLAATTTELDDSWLDGLLLPAEPESANQRTTHDGHALRPHEETIAEIEEIGRAIFHELGRPDDNSGTQLLTDATQPTTAPGNAPEPSYGWSAWDEALEQLTQGTYTPAPTDPITTPASPSSTDRPGTAEFHSRRPDTQQPGLAGTIPAEGQPHTTRQSVLTTSTPDADTTADVGITTTGTELAAQPLVPTASGPELSELSSAPYQANRWDLGSELVFDESTTAATPIAERPASEAGAPRPTVTPQGAQANSPQQSHATTPPLGLDTNNLAAQTIPPTALVAATPPSGNGPSNPDTTAGSSTPPPAMSGGQPTDNDQTHSDPEEFPDRIGTIVTPPMPSYVPAQPQIDEYPNNAPDEYTKPPGTTYKIPGQPDAPDGPPPNAIPVIPRPSTQAVPKTGPAIPLTDRPQVPIPDTAVPGAPAEDDEQKPRVHDSEPPLPRHNNTPAPHLPATPADRPTELTPPARYATPPNPETPGAPTDPTAAPQLNRDSTQYIPDPTVQPTRGGIPATTLAGPLPEPVVAARPVPMASAPPDKPKKGKRKQDTPQPEPPQTPTEPPKTAPETPTPIPVPTPQPKKRKKNQPSGQPIREEFVVREASEATGEVGEEGERVRAASSTRAWVRSLRQKFPWLTEDQIDTAELLISELVANSLRHTQGKVAVIATATDTDDVRKTRFTVTDESEVIPESTGMPDWDAERGRGGEFVAMLSDDHGAAVQGNGKSTWFELHTPLGGAPGLGIPSAAPDNDDSGSDTADPPPPAVDVPTGAAPTAAQANASDGQTSPAQFYNDVDPAVDHGFFKRRKIDAHWVLNKPGAELESDDEKYRRRAIAYVGAGMHEDWRDKRRKSAVVDSWKPVTNEVWRERHRFDSPNHVRWADGGWQINIVKYASSDLPEDRQAESAETAEIAVDAVADMVRTGTDIASLDSMDLIDLVDENGFPAPEKVAQSGFHDPANTVHERWLERNEETAQTKQLSGYFDLDAEQQYYDLIPVYLAVEYHTAHHLDSADAASTEQRAFEEYLDRHEWSDPARRAHAVRMLEMSLQDAVANGHAMVWWRLLDDGTLRAAVHGLDQSDEPWLTAEHRHVLESVADRVMNSGRAGGAIVHFEMRDTGSAPNMQDANLGSRGNPAPEPAATSSESLESVVHLDGEQPVAAGVTAAQPEPAPHTPTQTAANTAPASTSTPPTPRPLPGRGLPYAIGGGDQRWDGEEEWMKPARQRVPGLGVLHNNGGGATRGGRQRPDHETTHELADEPDNPTVDAAPADIDLVESPQVVPPSRTAAETPTDEAPREFEKNYDGSAEARIKGQVYGDGLLAFEVRRGPSTPGHVMFADMMDSIGGQVRAIAGSWDVTDPIGTSNIDSFNEGIARDLSPEEAARNTFTGKMAVRSGFTGVWIIDAAGPVGQHTSATVLFTKPGDLTDPMHYLRSAFEQTSGQHADTTPAAHGEGQSEGEGAVGDPDGAQDSSGAHGSGSGNGGERGGGRTEPARDLSALPSPTAPQSDDATVGQQTNPTGDEQAVTGTIIPHVVKGMRGPHRTSVAGVVTRVDPASGPDSLVLHAVEARRAGHPDLRAAIGRPLTIGIEFDDLVVECMIWYRIHDDGRRDVWIAHEDPDVGNPKFEKVRRMIDAALLSRFPDALIEITEDFAGKIVQVKRVLGPTVPAETTSTADDRPRQADGEHDFGPVNPGPQMPNNAPPSGTAPETAPIEQEHPAYRSGSYPSAEPIDSAPSPYAISNSVDRLQALRNAVAAEHADAAFDPADRTPTEAERLARLENALVLLDELLTVESDPNPPIPAPRHRLLRHFADAVDNWLRAAERALAAESEFRQLEPTAAQRARMGAEAADRFEAAARRLAEVTAQLAAANTDVQVRADSTGLLQGVDLDVLQMISEWILAELPTAAAAVDDAEEDSPALDQALGRYWGLQDNFAALEALIAVMEQPGTLISRHQLATLVENFRANTSWITDWLNLQNTARTGSTRTITELDQRLTAALEDYTAADSTVRDLAAALAAFGPRRPEPAADILPRGVEAVRGEPSAPGAPTGAAPARTDAGQPGTQSHTERPRTDASREHIPPTQTAANTAPASTSTPPTPRPLPGRGLPYAIGGGDQRWDGEEEWMKPARQRVPGLGVLHNNGGGAARGGRQRPDHASDTPTERTDLEANSAARASEADPATDQPAAGPGAGTPSHSTETESVPPAIQELLNRIGDETSWATESATQPLDSEAPARSNAPRPEENRSIATGTEAATAPGTDRRTRYDAVQMPPDMYMYTPETAATLDYTNVYPAIGGGIRDEDAPYTTGPEGDVFFLTANGDRTMPYPGTHALLYNTFSDPDIHLYAFGHWYMDGGRKVRIVFGSQMLPTASADLKYVAQGLFEMAERGVPVEFDDSILGDLWRKQIPVGVPTAGQLIDQRGESTSATVPGAHTIFPGATAQFWMYVTAIVPADDSLSIVFSINPVLGKPGRITLVLTRENDVITARYTDIALGEDADRVSAAIDEFHTRIVDPWLTASRATFTGSDAPVDTATDDPGARLQELRIRLEAARAELTEVLDVVPDLVRSGWIRQAVTIAQRWIRGLDETGWAAVASAADLNLLVDWMALRLPLLRDTEAANAAQADSGTQQQLADPGEQLDRKLGNLLGLSGPGPSASPFADDLLTELRALADATSEPELRQLVQAIENFFLADRAVATAEANRISPSGGGSGAGMTVGGPPPDPQTQFNNDVDSGAPEPATPSSDRSPDTTATSNTPGGRMMTRAEFAARLAQAERSGPPVRLTPDHMFSQNSITELLIYPDGLWAVEKSGLEPEDLAAEVLGSASGEAMEASVPPVIEVGEDAVRMPWLPGEPLPTSAEDPSGVRSMEALLNHPDADPLGLLDVVISNWDRKDNVLQDGDRLYGHDHAFAFRKPVSPPDSPFSRRYVSSVDRKRRPDPYEWAANQRSRSQLRRYERNFQALLPLFEAYGCPDWHQESLARLRNVIKHARTEQDEADAPDARPSSGNAVIEYQRGDNADTRPEDTVGEDLAGPATSAPRSDVADLAAAVDDVRSGQAHVNTTDIESAPTATDSGDPTEVSEQPVAIAGDSQVYHRLMAQVGDPRIARSLTAKVHARAAREQLPTEPEAAEQRLSEIAENVLAEHRAAMAQLDTAMDNKPTSGRQQRLTPFQHGGVFFHNLPGNQPLTPENRDQPVHEHGTGSTASDSEAGGVDPVESNSDALAHPPRSLVVGLAAQLYNVRAAEQPSTTAGYDTALDTTTDQTWQAAHASGDRVPLATTDFHTLPDDVLSEYLRLAEIALPVVLDAMSSGTDISSDEFAEHLSSRIHDGRLQHHWRTATPEQRLPFDDPGYPEELREQHRHFARAVRDFVVSASAIDRSTPDPFASCASGAEVATEMWRRHAVRMFGFDLPSVTVEVVREFARAIHVLLTKYPHVQLHQIGIGPVSDSQRFIVSDHVEGTDTRYPLTRSIMLSDAFATDPEFRAQTWTEMVHAGRAVGPLDQAIYGLVLGEFGYSLNNTGGEGADYYATGLADHHQSSHEGPTRWSPGAMYAWRKGEFRTYGKDRDGRFNATAALAGAFAAMEHDPTSASVGEEIVHDLLTSSALKRAAYYRELRELAAEYHPVTPVEQQAKLSKIAEMRANNSFRMIAFDNPGITLDTAGQIAAAVQHMRTEFLVLTDLWEFRSAPGDDIDAFAHVSSNGIEFNELWLAAPARMRADAIEQAAAGRLRSDPDLAYFCLAIHELTHGLRRLLSSNGSDMHSVVKSYFETTYGSKDIGRLRAWMARQFSSYGIRQKDGALDPKESEAESMVAAEVTTLTPTEGEVVVHDHLTALAAAEAERRGLTPLPARTNMPDWTPPPHIEYEVRPPNDPAFYQPEAVVGDARRTIRRPTVRGGLFYGQDGKKYTTNESEYFLIGADPEDIRTVNYSEIRDATERLFAPHAVLYSTYTNPDEGPIIFGYWRITNGVLEESSPAHSGTFLNGEQDADIQLKFSTHYRKWLITHQIDPSSIKIVGTLEGEMWRPLAVGPVPSVRELLDRDGLHAATVFGSSGNGFWVTVGTVQSTSTQLSIPLTINLLDGGSGTFTLDLTETTARVSDSDLTQGSHATELAAAFDILHTHLTAPWLAASGVTLSAPSVARNSDAQPAPQASTPTGASPTGTDADKPDSMPRRGARPPRVEGRGIDVDGAVDKAGRHRDEGTPWVINRFGGDGPGRDELQPRARREPAENASNIARDSDARANPERALPDPRLDGARPATANAEPEHPATKVRTSPDTSNKTPNNQASAKTADAQPRTPADQPDPKAVAPQHTVSAESSPIETNVAAGATESARPVGKTPWSSEPRKSSRSTPWSGNTQPAAVAAHSESDQSTDATASTASPRPQNPDTLVAYHTLHDWAATLSDDDAQQLIADTTAELAAHLDAFRHGAQPPVEAAVAAARLLNVLIWEQCHRIQANTHQGNIPDYATLFDLARDLETRLPAVRALLAAANAVFDLAGALRLNAPEDIPEPFSKPKNELNFLDSLPSHLGRMVDNMTKAVETMPWSEDWGFPRKTRPKVEHRGDTNAAIKAINGLAAHFEVREHDGTDWSEYIDGYLLTGLVRGFDADVARAIGALRSESDAFDPTRTESDRAFTAAAAEFLPNVVTVTSYYLTRTREAAAAFELLQIASETFAASAARLPDLQPLHVAAELVRHLRDAVAKERLRLRSDFQDPMMMRDRAFNSLVDHPRFPELLAQTVLALRRTAETPTTPDVHQAQAAAASVHEAQGLTRGRDLIDQLDYRRADSEHLDAPIGIDDPIEDPAMTYIARTRGFDALPTVAGPEEVDALVDAGSPEMFRGVRDLRYGDEFSMGRYITAIPLSSSFGIGIYASSDREVALGYADDRPEGVSRMALRPGARWTDFTSLRAEMDAVTIALDDEERRLTAREQTAEVRASLRDLSIKREILSDPGRFAAVRGYDAYYVREPGAADIWIILNRSAVVVAENTRAESDDLPTLDLPTPADAEPVSHAPYGPDEVRSLTVHAAQLPLPFDINTACTKKAEAILAELLRIGVDRNALGIARSFVPDLSADGLERAYRTGEVMKKDRQITASFSDRLRAGVGIISLEDRVVEFEGARFAGWNIGPVEVIVVSAKTTDEQMAIDGRWTLPAPGEYHNPFYDSFGNHVAATIEMLDTDGQLITMVIDPSFEPMRPMTLAEWRDRQNYSDVIVLTNSMTDPAGAPFNLRTELMPNQQRARYEATLEQYGDLPENEILSVFFNLQTDDPMRSNSAITRPEHDRYSGYLDQYSYSLHLRSTILSGNNLGIIMASDSTDYAVEWLAPVRSYQKWLEATEHPESAADTQTSLDPTSEASAQPDPASPTGATTIDEPPAEMAFQHPGHNPFAPERHRAAGPTRARRLPDQLLGHIDNDEIPSDHVPWDDPKQLRRAQSETTPAPAARTAEPETPTDRPAADRARAAWTRIVDSVFGSTDRSPATAPSEEDLDAIEQEIQEREARSVSVELEATDEQIRLAEGALAKLPDYLGAGASLPSLTAPVDPDQVVEQSATRAKQVAHWWHALSDVERAAMIAVHPHIIGNADGVLYAERDVANRRSINLDIEEFLKRKPDGPKGFLTQLRQVGRSRVLTPAETRHLTNLVRTRQQLAAIEREVRDIGSPVIQLIAYDATAYDGDGRCTVAIDDADKGELVTRNIGGVGTTLQKLPLRAKSGIAQFEVSAQHAPDVTAVTIIDIGYHHPNSLEELWSSEFAEQGAHIVAADIAAYDATREAWTELTGATSQRLRTVAAHSYGSTTLGFAGQNGQLAEHIDQIVITGSPGLPMEHAEEFGIGAENVYVVADDRDPVSKVGGDIGEDSDERYFGFSHGVDPAGRRWGAVRLTGAQPRRSFKVKEIHGGYYSFADLSSRVPTTSLNNIALVSAGRAAEAERAAHRPPATGSGRVRDLIWWTSNIADVTTPDHTGPSFEPPNSAPDPQHDQDIARHSIAERDDVARNAGPADVSDEPAPPVEDSQVYHRLMAALGNPRIARDLTVKVFARATQEQQSTDTEAAAQRLFAIAETVLAEHLDAMARLDEAGGEQTAPSNRQRSGVTKLAMPHSVDGHPLGEVAKRLGIALPAAEQLRDQDIEQLQTAFADRLRGLGGTATPQHQDDATDETQTQPDNPGAEGTTDRRPAGGLPSNPLPPGVELFHHTDPNPVDPHFP
ncbi:alpha/beta hydrolase [Nocardia sp. NPDC049707]|uniref:alpha/beta hydrolase n=1 Tax=Nocardia sp. NPDC049707 TaxID=3154735 RepID=UPI00343D6BB8